MAGKNSELAKTKPVADLDHSDKEGHGEEAPKPLVKKGTFIGVGTYAPLEQHRGISANVKTGTPSGEHQ